MKKPLHLQFSLSLLILLQVFFSGEAQASSCVTPPVAGNTVSSATIVCPSAPFTLSLSGATTGTGQTYQWQSSVTGAQGSWTNLQGETGSTAFLLQQVATWYRAVVTCNGQSDTSSPVQVQVHPSPVVNLGADTSVCSGDTPFIIDAGAGFVSYQWNTNDTTQTIGITAAGNYIVTVTDTNGCIGSDNIQVIINPSPIVALGSDTTICEGESIIFFSGLPPFPPPPPVYCFMNDVPVQCHQPITTSGKYKVIVTNFFGCTASDSINIIVLPAPVVDLGSDTAICQGDSIVIDLPQFWPHPSYACRWEDNSTNCTRIIKDAGVYSVTVTGMNGCSTKDTIEVTVNPLPNSDFTYVETVPGKVEFFAIEANAAHYFWDFDDNGKTATGRMVNNMYPGDGTYFVKLIVTANNGCVDSLIQPTIIFTPSTKFLKGSENELKISPNPFRKTTIIRYTTNHTSGILLEVFDMMGKKVATLVDGLVPAGEHAVQFHPGDFGYTSGQFLVRLIQDGKVSVTQVIGGAGN